MSLSVGRGVRKGKCPNICSNSSDNDYMYSLHPFSILRRLLRRHLRYAATDAASAAASSAATSAATYAATWSPPPDRRV